MHDYRLIHAILPTGKATQCMMLLREIQIQGGTILMAKGTARGKWIDFLGLNEIRKEMILLAAPKNQETPIYETVWDFLEEKKLQGILFSIPLTCFTRNLEYGENTYKEDDTVSHQVIVTIVDRGGADKVVEIAQREGATGGTILHGRGSAQQEKIKLFDMVVDPEKELVLILAKEEETKRLIDAITLEMELEKPGKGILFTMPVTRTRGTR